MTSLRRTHAPASWMVLILFAAAVPANAAESDGLDPTTPEAAGPITAAAAGVISVHAFTAIAAGGGALAVATGLVHPFADAGGSLQTATALSGLVFLASVGATTALSTAVVVWMTGGTIREGSGAGLGSGLAVASTLPASLLLAAGAGLLTFGVVVVGYLTLAGPHAFYDPSMAAAGIGIGLVSSGVAVMMAGTLAGGAGAFGAWLGQWWGGLEDEARQTDPTRLGRLPE